MMTILSGFSKGFVHHRCCDDNSLWFFEGIWLSSPLGRPISLLKRIGHHPRYKENPPIVEGGTEKPLVH